MYNIIVLTREKKGNIKIIVVYNPKCTHGISSSRSCKRIQLYVVPFSFGWSAFAIYTDACAISPSSASLHTHKTKFFSPVQAAFSFRRMWQNNVEFHIECFGTLKHKVKLFTEMQRIFQKELNIFPENFYFNTILVEVFHIYSKFLTKFLL